MVKKNRGERAGEMKQKNPTFYHILRSFFEDFPFSPRENIVICLLSLIIVLGSRILFMPSLAQEKFIMEGGFTAWEETMLLSLLMYWKVFAICVLASIPIMIILCLILWGVSKRNMRKLKGVNQQWEKIPWLQNNGCKKSNREDHYEIVSILFAIVLGFVTVYISLFTLLLLELSYGVFKQARLYSRVKGELKGALQEQKTTFVKS